MEKSHLTGRLALTISLLALAGTAILAWRGHLRSPAPAESSHGGEWLPGAPQGRIAEIEKHLRGFDVAMMEVGYRFTELYFAGRDRNWGYARYHKEKMELAIRLAMTRRPKRAESAEEFLRDSLPPVLEAIESQDSGRFQKAMERMRTACMNCHNREDVPYFTVELPEHRLSPVRRVD